MNYNELSKKAHANAIKHGFWEEKMSNEHCLMLVITEIAELVEAHRKEDYAYVDAFEKHSESVSFDENFERHIKNSVQDELADTVIRLFDLAGALGVDFNKMTPCRYYRAFDKFSFTENAFALCKGLSRDAIAIEKRIQFGISYVDGWAKLLGVDLGYHVKMKMRYNASRPIRHNKLY